MNKKIFGSICFVLGITIIISTGTTFAYFNSSANSDGTISGSTLNFAVDLSLSKEHVSNNMIPISDSLIKTAISGSKKCIDNNGYEVCSLYKITLTNNGDPFVLNGYIKTNSTTYTTGNLKYQIYDTNFNPLSDALTLSLTSGDKIYFSKGNDILTTSINHNIVEYYLVMWITETNSLQSADYSKKYNGVVGFETVSGNKIETVFNA